MRKIRLTRLELDVLVNDWYMLWLKENEGVIQSEYGSDLEEIVDSTYCIELIILDS